MRGDPPRHIRDIAHLYLSGMRRPDGGGVRLVVAGMSADVIPAFHVANLALATAGRGASVRLEDRSGLPVNAGCFLGLDPSCWVPTSRGHGSSVAAWARVTFVLVREGETDAQVSADVEPWDGVEIIHVPTCDAGSDHAQAVTRATSRAGPSIVLYLAERDEPPYPWRDGNGRADVRRRVAYVTHAGRAGDGDRCVGSFTRWTPALTDPLPAAVRDPGSRLARQYAAAVSALLLETSPAAHAGTRHRIASNHAATPPKPR